MHVKVLLLSILCTKFMLTAQAVFLLERGHADTQSHDATYHPTHASVIASVDNEERNYELALNSLSPETDFSPPA